MGLAPTYQISNHRLGLAAALESVQSQVRFVSSSRSNNSRHSGADHASEQGGYLKFNKDTEMW